MSEAIRCTRCRIIALILRNWVIGESQVRIITLGVQWSVDSASKLCWSFKVGNRSRRWIPDVAVRSGDDYLEGCTPLSVVGRIGSTFQGLSK